MLKHEDLPDEVWREIPSAPGFKVSNMGRVMGKRGRVLVRSKNFNGYPIVWLQGCSPKKRAVHAIVLKTFVGPRPDGMQARHLNGCKDDARLENLAWGTAKENSADRVVHGTLACGEKSGTAKLTSKDVLEIRAAYDGRGNAKSWIPSQLCRKYGINDSTLRKVALRKSWKRIES